jgi:predicted ATPase
MAKLFIFVGLPGSGKSYQLRELEKAGTISHDCIYHDYHADAPSDKIEDSLHYQSLINNLKNEKDCAVADIAFCEQARRENFVAAIERTVQGVQTFIKYFENKPEICKKNVAYASRKSAMNRTQKIDEFSWKYKIPQGADIIEVGDWSSKSPI